MKKITLGIYGIKDINNSKIPTLSHDHGIVVMQNGKVLHHAQLERIDRQKHSKNMPAALYELLKQKKWLTEDFNLIITDNVLGRSLINDEGNLRIEAKWQGSLCNTYEKARGWWLDKPRDAFVISHELAHLGSCLPFFGAFKNNSLLIHFDGGASLSNFSAWAYKNGELTNIEYHWGLKYLSSLYNANALVFGMVGAKAVDLNSVPGKFMGFASLGKYNPELEQWLTENDFFKDCWKSKKPFFESAKANFGVELNYLDQKNEFIQNVACTIQHVFIKQTFEKIVDLQEKTQTDYLYFSGGSALNILLNNKLIASEAFKNVFIPPCCNDSGLALGAAAFFEWKNGNNIQIHSPYLENWGIEDYSTSINNETIKKAAQLLIHNKVIGIANGFGEIGPRALGNRSIISLASSNKLAQKVSMEHKQREWYRPVAPIMLEKNAKYFTGLHHIHHLSKYMLVDFNILPERQNEMIGAVHKDGTARIQTLFARDENPFMYELLCYLDEKHGVKALINTSFNHRGEPIVHTLEQARESAMAMHLDAVVLNGKLESFQA